jgi:hypothetical protein
MQIIVIGRGHSGTRAIANTLIRSGVYMGSNLSSAGDRVPGKHMYEVAKMAGDYVRFIKPYEWDFSELTSMPVPNEVIRHIEDYHAPHFDNQHEVQGWKLPETTLCLPWIVKLYPDAYYIHWVRDGRDNILKYHDTQHMDRWHIPHEVPENSRNEYCRAVSWKYHEDLVQATPKPKYWLTMTLTEFVTNQERALDKLELFLGMDLVKIDVFEDAIGRYQYSGLNLSKEIKIMKPQLIRHGFMEVKA